MKKKKKHWTSKNTHLKKSKKKSEDNAFITHIDWMTILYIILIIILIALNSNYVGYDYFPSIPYEWIKWLK